VRFLKHKAISSSSSPKPLNSIVGVMRNKAKGKTGVRLNNHRKVSRHNITLLLYRPPALQRLPVKTTTSSKPHSQLQSDVITQQSALAEPFNPMRRPLKINKDPKPSHLEILQVESPSSHTLFPPQVRNNLDMLLLPTSFDFGLLKAPYP